MRKRTLTERIKANVTDIDITPRLGSATNALWKLGTPTTDSNYQKRYNEALGPTEKGRILTEYSAAYSELFSKSAWVKTALAVAPHMRGHFGEKKAKTLTPSKINALLEKWRKEQSPVDWNKLTDEQEKCARLRWQCGLSVSMIARSLGKHRTTIDEHLARAKARLDPVGKHGIAS